MVSALFLLLMFLGVQGREGEQDKDGYKDKWNISLWTEQTCILSRCAFFSGLVDAIILYFPNFLALKEQGGIIRYSCLFSTSAQKNFYCGVARFALGICPFSSSFEISCAIFWLLCCHNQAMGKVLSKENKLVLLTVTSRSTGKGSFKNFLKNFFLYNRYKHKLT